MLRRGDDEDDEDDIEDENEDDWLWYDAPAWTQKVTLPTAEGVWNCGVTS